MVAGALAAGPVVLVIVAAALLAWPAGGLRRPSHTAFRGSLTRRTADAGSLVTGAGSLVTGRASLSPALAGLGVLILAGPTIGWPVGVASGMLTATVLRLVQRARRSARQHDDRVAVVAALRALVREIDAGGAPAQALDRVRDASAGTPGRGSGAVHRLVDAVARPMSAPEPDDPVLAALTTRTRVAWAVATVHGVPLSILIEALAADLADQLAGRRARAAQTAGPALSGYLLAGMPAVGMLFGLGMGVDPVRVLVGSSTGGVLAIAGAALCCGGLLWSDRIVRT